MLDISYTHKMFQSASSGCASRMLVTFSVIAILAQILILLDFGDTNTNNFHRPGTIRVVFFAVEFMMAFLIMVACVSTSFWRNVNQRQPANDEERPLANVEDGEDHFDGFGLVELRGGRLDRSERPDRYSSISDFDEDDSISQVENCNASPDPCPDTTYEDEDLPLYEVLFTPEDIQLLQFAGFDLGSIGLETMHEQC